MEKKIIVAVDGHSSCGKSTMAKALAKRHHYIYVDTGAMYRAVTLFALRQGWFDGEQLDEDALTAVVRDIPLHFVTNEAGQSEMFIGEENVEKEIRGMEVANRVSIVAAIGKVREALVEMQQAMGLEKGIVMDGRDIGTVVFPQAELKIFVTADTDVRAQRRYDELIVKGQPASMEEIKKNIETRDYIDSHREVGPLRQAEDAILLDNSQMTIEEQDEWFDRIFNETVHGQR